MEIHHRSDPSELLYHEREVQNGDTVHDLAIGPASFSIGQLHLQFTCPPPLGIRHLLAYFQKSNWLM